MSFPIPASLSALEKLHEGQIATVAEFCEAYVFPYLPEKDVIKHWHRLLMEYVDQPDAVLLLRRNHGHFKDLGDESLRRGFLTLDPTGFGYVFGDNVLPQFVAGWVLVGEMPTPEEWRNAVHDRTLPIVANGFITQPERRFNLFKIGTTALGSRGWKLAHLYGVNNTAYLGFNYRVDMPDIATRGSYLDWDTTDKVRRLAEPISAAHRQLLVAHFLRAVHPLNYFLSPGTKHQVTKPDVGENIAVQQYVRQRFVEFYGADLVTELESRLLLPVIPTVVDTAQLGSKLLSVVVKWYAKPLKAKPPKAQKSAVRKRIKLNIDGSKKNLSNLKSEDYSFAPADHTEFKRQFLKSGQAKVTAFRADGTIIWCKNWPLTRFKATSNLVGNVKTRSDIRFEAESPNITKVHVQVVAT